jgi:Ser-tRNA(Ala) deacylase AlaX
VCPCGGTHVKNALDIGTITVTAVKANLKKGVVKISYDVTPA